MTTPVEAKPSVQGLTIIAEKCGATIYRNRSSIHTPAVAFGDEAWTRFAESLEAPRIAPEGQARSTKEKIAPVQGYSAGIPWSLHLEAYDAYSKKWAPQPALIDLEGKNCRGGFSSDELDEFIPGWRDRASEISKLRSAKERGDALLLDAMNELEWVSGHKRVDSLISRIRTCLEGK